MSMMKTVLNAAIFSVLFLSGGNLSAQVSPIRLGVRLGGGMSVNTGMDKILVPEAQQVRSLNIANSQLKKIRNNRYKDFNDYQCSACHCTCIP